MFEYMSVNDCKLIVCTTNVYVDVCTFNDNKKLTSLYDKNNLEV